MESILRYSKVSIPLIVRVHYRICTCKQELSSGTDDSSIAMLHSPLFERNVGKSLTLNILAKAERMPSRRHPTMLAGGDQSQSGTVCKCGYCNTEKLSHALEFRCCNEVTAAIGKVTLKGIEGNNVS
ncbi:hypothetical protein P5673_028512 [Acropora cervicornis]|uniref:Uncharacterized protein n=1 Tax=Acropora cervicornis TaxID=6130 RepID=A0AAD9UUZ6_ACRCE|nr:hypothetical protein P5673_028512 [Acropora cervicornis]